MYAVDKLSIINDALIATGNLPVAVDDGSDEWIAGSSYYERCLPLVLARHDWKFATDIKALTRAGASAYPGFVDMYEMPADCLWLRDCWDKRDGDQAARFSADRRGQSREGVPLPPFDYRIIGGLIHCTAPDGVFAFYIQNPRATDAFPVGFTEVLRLEIEALLARGFNEDATSAPALKALAMKELSEARSRDDQQEPRKVIFRSHLLDARRRRNRGW